jgi:hypothetical protein
MRVSKRNTRYRFMPYIQHPTTSILRLKRMEYEEDRKRKIIICQRYIKYWFARRKRKAIIITRACHNWVWKPICNDGTLGIRLRLDLNYMNETWMK